MLHVFLPDELITEVLSFLPVRSLMRLRCVCKSWKTLISDPTFVNLHLKQSTRNKHIAIFSNTDKHQRDLRIVSHVPMHRLLENTSLTIANDPYFDDIGYIYNVGSYNGLLCLLTYNYAKYLLYLWNPATRSLSNKIELVSCDDKVHTLDHSIFGHWLNWGFGYDNSTGTYKIVSLCRLTNEARVLRIGDNVWKNIQSFPDSYMSICHSDGVYVKGSLNWLTTIRRQSQQDDGRDHDAENVTINQFVIISLDLSTETFRKLLPVPPRGFDKVPRTGFEKLGVLMDTLCFSHDFNETDLIIWKMKEFGVQESWIQFLKISYKSLPIFYNVGYHLMILFPLYLSENGNTLILTSSDKSDEQAILYNLRDNTAEKTRITNKVVLSFSKDYVESLVSTC